MYRAEQPALGRTAVIKVQDEQQTGDPQRKQRFLREARLASQLDHPYAAHIYSFGAEPDGLLWIAMEFVRGTSLDRLLEAQGPLPLERFLPLFDRICEVVQTAHEQGIIHRDLKPANVMVVARAGRLLPKLVDFGVAKERPWGGAPEIETPPARPQPHAESVAADVTLPRGADGGGDAGGGAGAGDAGPGSRTLVSRFELTHSGVTLGSPGYMAPEQWSDASAVDARTDLYALGILTYESLTGHRPFEATTLPDLYEAHRHQPVPRLAGGLPASLDAVLGKALAKRPEDRYQTVLEFAAALRKAADLHGQAIDLPPQLDELVREAVVTSGPRPLADAVVALEAARNAHQARDAIWQVLRVAARYVGLVSLACRTRIGPGSGAGDSPQVVQALRALRARTLTDREWVSLASELIRPFAGHPEVYPVPELVTLFFESERPAAGSATGPFEALVALRESQDDAGRTAEPEVRALVVRGLEELARLLRALAFLSDYRLAVVKKGRAERWMGIRRALHAQVPLLGKRLPEGRPFLVDREGYPLLALWPLMQAEAPAPGEREELFLLEGKGRHGARLTALPMGFERVDEGLWDWCREHLFDADPGTDAARGESAAPYRGLATFKPADAEMFFGREREVEGFVNRLRLQALLAVVGPSGAGKSSFVQAGVLPALGNPWRAVTVRPGPAPLAALGARLAQEGIPVGDLSAEVGRDRDALGAILRAAAQRFGVGLVLVIDQFEELFTLGLDPGRQGLYAEALARAARSVEEPVRVVLTLRDDFLIRAEKLPGLCDRLAQGLQLLSTPRAEDLVRILVEPARRAGYQFEDPELPAEMARDVADHPGALALLSFAAARLWELRDRHFKQLSRRAYDSMGGVGGALAQHAEQTIAEMVPEEQRLVRQAFRHLVTAEGTRAVLTRAELGQLLGGGPRATAAIERLVAARLLVASEGEGSQDIVEVAHETLLFSWPRLVQWRHEDAEGARFRDQLRAASRHWEDRGRSQALLWRDEVLMEYRLWRARYPGGLTDSEEAFVHASLREAARGRRARGFAVGAAFVALTVIAAVLFRMNARAQEQRTLAVAARQQAERSALESRRQLAAFYREEGRQALLADDPLHAIVYLGEAARIGESDPALRFLVAWAGRALRARSLALEGHGDAVGSAAFSPDGSRVVTASADGTARVWDATSGRVLLQVGQEGDPLWFASFSPDGSRLLTGGRTAALLWNARSGARLRLLQRAGTAIAEFSPDGAHILVGNDDGFVRTFRATTGAPELVLPVHARGSGEAAARPGNILAVAFGGDGLRILAMTDDGMVHMFAAADGRRLAGFRLAEHAKLDAAAFDPSGRRLVTMERNRPPGVWDVATHERRLVLVGHAGSARSAAFSPDGGRIVTSGTDGTAKIWDASTGKLLDSLVGHAGTVLVGRFDRTGKRVVTAGLDKSARIWDLRPERSLRTLGRPGAQVSCAAFSPDGTRLLAVQPHDLRLWDSRTGEPVAAAPGLAEARCAAFDPAGARIVVASGNNALVWDAATLKPLGVLRGHDAPVWAAAFSPDGAQVVTASLDHTARIWDVRRASAIVTLGEHAQGVWSAAYSPDGSAVVTASQDGTARLWDARTGRPGVLLRGHLGSVLSARFSPDGARIATVGQDNTAKIWDAASGALFASLEGHTGTVDACAFSPDGARLATASIDGSARIWDVQSGRLLANIDPHAGPLYGVEFSTDGSRLAVASEDGLVRIWDVELDRRSPAELARWIRCHVPLRLEEGRLLPNRADPATCAP